MTAAPRKKWQALIGIGTLSFVAAGQVFLAIAALVQLQFELASPALLVLVGLGLFGFGGGLQQATTTAAVASIVSAAAAGVAIGTLWTFWNLGSSIGLAIGGLIFEVMDKRSLDGALARDGITLTDKDRELVRSLLSDPSQAHEILGKLSPGLEAEILPLFQNAFMDGFAGAMWYLVITGAIGGRGRVVDRLARAKRRVDLTDDT